MHDRTRLEEALRAIGARDQDMPLPGELVDDVIVRVLAIVCEYAAETRAQMEQRIAALELRD